MRLTVFKTFIQECRRTQNQLRYKYILKLNYTMVYTELSTGGIDDFSIYVHITDKPFPTN